MDPWILISKCAAEQKIPEESYNVTEGEDLIPDNKEREAGFMGCLMKMGMTTQVQFLLSAV